MEFLFGSSPASRGRRASERWFVRRSKWEGQFLRRRNRSGSERGRTKPRGRRVEREQLAGRGLSTQQRGRHRRPIRPSRRCSARPCRRRRTNLAKRCCADHYLVAGDVAAARRHRRCQGRRPSAGRCGPEAAAAQRHRHRPEYRGYDYVVANDEVAIVQPSTRQVVEIISECGEAATNGTTTGTTDRAARMNPCGP
jgi:hypothetical protein